MRRFAWLLTANTGSYMMLIGSKLPPNEIVVHTNMADVEVFVDDRPIGIARSDQLSFEAGPFWPGEYEVKAVYNGEFAVLETSRGRSL